MSNWLERILKDASLEVASWPAWMRNDLMCKEESMSKGLLTVEDIRRCISASSHSNFSLFDSGLNEFILADELNALIAQRQSSEIEAIKTAARILSSDKWGAAVGAVAEDYPWLAEAFGIVAQRQQERPCETCGEADADGGGVWVDTPTKDSGTHETWMCGGCVSKRGRRIACESYSEGYHQRGLDMVAAAQGIEPVHGKTPDEIIAQVDAESDHDRTTGGKI